MPGIGFTEVLIIATVLVTAAIARSRYSWRFGLRDLLIAVTVIAVVLGAIGYAIR